MSQGTTIFLQNLLSFRRPLNNPLLGSHYNCVWQVFDLFCIAPGRGNKAISESGSTFGFISAMCINNAEMDIKCSIFFKNRLFLIQEKCFNKKIYGINRIIKCGV